MSENEQTGDAQDGMIIEGSNQAIYFIPSDRLDEFRVDDAAAAPARDSIEHIEGEVSGFSFKEMDFGLKPGISSLRAFEGPLRMEGMGDMGTTKKTKTMYSLG